MGLVKSQFLLVVCPCLSTMIMLRLVFEYGSQRCWNMLELRLPQSVLVPPRPGQGKALRAES